MILLSYLYATQFEIIPLVQKSDVEGNHPSFDKSMLGKMRPDFAIGSTEIPVNNLAGKDPIVAIDGLYEAHVRKYPSFLETSSRYQPIQGIINALCRYITSTHTIGKGSNAFGWVYLPWFIVPKGGIKIHEVDFNKNGMTKQLKLEDEQGNELKYVARSIYFNKNFNLASNGSQVNRITTNANENLVIPEKINISSDVIIQTDRKLTLPDIPTHLQALNKLPLPGDINTKSSTDLMYNWYIPITNNNDAQMLYINSLVPTSGKETTDKEITISIPTTHWGVLRDDNWVIKYVDRLYPSKKSVVYPELSIEQSNPITIERNIFRTTDGSYYVSYFELSESGRKIPELPATGIGVWSIHGTIPDQNYVTTISKEKHGNYYIEKYELNKKGIEYLFGDANVNIVNNDLTMILTYNIYEGLSSNRFRSTISYSGSLSYQKQRTTFTDGTVTLDHEVIVSSYNFEDRQVIFDRLGWKEYLEKYGLLNAQKIPLSFNVINYKDTANNHGWEIDRVDEVTIKTLWSSDFIFIVNGVTYKIPSINKDDETITTQKIIFT